MFPYSFHAVVELVPCTVGSQQAYRAQKTVRQYILHILHSQISASCTVKTSCTLRFMTDGSHGVLRWKRNAPMVQEISISSKVLWQPSRQFGIWCGPIRCKCQNKIVSCISPALKLMTHDLQLTNNDWERLHVRAIASYTHNQFGTNPSISLGE